MSSAAAAEPLRRNRDYHLLLFGEGVSGLGTAVTATALPIVILAATGSGIAMAAAAVLATIPDLLFGLVAGLGADTRDRQKVMVVANVGRGALMFAMAAVIGLGFDVMVAVALVFPINVLRVFFLAALGASLPSVVGREHIARARGYGAAVFSSASIVGPGIAAISLTVLGPALTLGIDAATFVISAISIRLIRRPLQAASNAVKGSALAEIKIGLSFLIKEPTLRAVVPLGTIVAVCHAPLIPALVFFMSVDQGWDIGTLGVVFTINSFMFVVGAVAAGRFIGSRQGVVMLIANMATAIGLATFVLVDDAVVRFFAIVVIGATGALFFIPFGALTTSIPPDHLLGRVGSTIRMLMVGLMPLSLVPAGIAFEAFGGGPTIVGIATIMAMVSVVFALSGIVRAATARV